LAYKTHNYSLIYSTHNWDDTRQKKMYSLIMNQQGSKHVGVW